MESKEGNTCKDSTEIKHAKELLLMEEEARIRRRNLAKRISYEHCIQQREKGDIIKKLEKDTQEAEKEIAHEIHQLEMYIAGIKAQTEVLDDCLENRKKDLQRSHDNQVDRLKSYMEDLKTELDDVEGQDPEVDDQLGQLQNLEEAEGTKAVQDLEDQLRAVREESRKLCQQSREEQDRMRQEEDMLPKDDELINLEDELKETQHEARRLQELQDDDIDDIVYETNIIHKTMETIEGEDVDAMVDKLQEEVTALENELEEENATLEGLADEAAELGEHFAHKFETKIQLQNRRIEEERADLANRNDQVDRHTKEIEDAIKQLPSEYDKKARLKQEQLQGKVNKLKEIQGDMSDKFEDEIKKLEADQAEQLSKLQERLQILQEKETQMKENYDVMKSQIEKQINELTEEIPNLVDEIQKLDREFVDTMSEKQADLGKTDVINQMLTQSNDNALNHFQNEMENLDNLLEKTKSENASEIARKEEELQVILDKHRQVGTDLEFIDKKVKMATQPLRSETDHLKYKIQCLGTIMRDQNKILANLDGTAAETEHEIHEAMKRAAVAHEEEMDRLEKMIESEERDQEYACDQLKDAINRATERHEEMLNNHKEQRDVLIQKLTERQKDLDTKFDLDKQVNNLGLKIQELDNRLENALARHQVNVKQTQYEHTTHMETLQRKRGAQMFRIDQQQKLDSKVDEMQEMLSSVNRGLEAINAEALVVEQEEEEELKDELDKINRDNESLARKIMHLNSKKDELLLPVEVPTEERTTISTERGPSQSRSRRLSNSGYNKELQQLQKKHAKLQKELPLLRQRLKKLQEEVNRAGELADQTASRHVECPSGSKKETEGLKLHTSQPQALSSLGRLASKINSKEQTSAYGEDSCHQDCKLIKCVTSRKEEEKTSKKSSTNKNKDISDKPRV